MFVQGANGAVGGYNLARSLRFRASASAYLSRTPASTGNRQVWTFVALVKRGTLGTVQGLLTGSDTSADTSVIDFYSDNTLRFYTDRASANVFALATSGVWRDPAAFYQVIVSVDTTQATAANRVKIYKNGEQQTLTGSYPSLNYQVLINGTDVQRIGKSLSNYFDGYLADVYFIDGQALTPSSFGSTNATTGVWQPAKYTGTYGTNGFYLPFTDNSALTTSSNVGLGKDFSGNGNYWTTNNISITAGVTYDSMTDVPTLTSATAANFATWNPLTKASNSTLVDGNLLIGNTAAAIENIRSTMPTAGTLSYWEYIATTVSSSMRIDFGGILSAYNQSVPNNTYIAGSGPTGTFGAVFNSGMAFYVNGAQVGSTYGTTTLTGTEVIMFAHDSSTGKVWCGLNGVWYNSGNPASGTGQVATLTAGTVFPAVMVNGGGGNNRVTANFGQRPFTYTPPSGFVALNAYNLPSSTIVKGNTVMDATTYTGNGSTQTITNAAGFKPDLVWVKQRNGTFANYVFDSNRGATKRIVTNTTAVEDTASGVTSFNSNGFTLGSDTGENNSGSTFVGWQWQAGQGTTSTNTSGSITSTVSVNASAGFSIVTYTGTGANATVGHGLGVAPSMIIGKDRSNTYTWVVYHQKANTNPASGYLPLNSAGAFSADSAIWNNTAPTSSVFSIGAPSGGTNISGDNYVMYCWAEIAGFSKFGSYVGNGNADGVFVYTGFKPKYLMIKSSTLAIDWIVEDSSRNTYNVVNSKLSPNTSGAEFTGSTIGIDFLSNGFKLRGSDGAINSLNDTYIFAAFAQTPSKYSLAR